MNGCDIVFIDEVILKLQAGSGGKGCMAFRREKFLPMGGPYGGDGGKGSDIIFEVDRGLNTLIDLRYQKIIKGKNGANGLGKGMHGSNAENIIIKVPEGTVITDLETGFVIADLVKKDDKVVICKGGRGGRGNIALATKTNPAPKLAENGEEGEFRKVKIELKLLADVGLVGLPSVGKSTLISKISKSKPKIADYPFTTLTPNLGVVKAGNNKSFVVADLPGLIKNASLGAGLGDKFLKHIERTRVIAHIIDVTRDNPYDDYLTINKELENFDKKLLKKPQIVIANKIDVPNNHLKDLEAKLDVPIYKISAINSLGIDDVLIKLSEMLDEIKKEPLYDSEQFETHVLYKFQEEQPFDVVKDGNIFVIKGKQVEKLLKMTRFTSDEAFLRFSRKLRKMGIDDELKNKGIKEGDIVRIIDFEFEYKDD